MKYLLLALLTLSFNVQAACYMNNGIMYCPPVDYRGNGNSPIIVDQNGQYRGNLNNNQYDPNSVSNPYGNYGSQYSPNSLNNPYAQPIQPYVLPPLGY